MLMPCTLSSVAHACPSLQPAGAGAQDFPPLHSESTAGHSPGPSGCPDPRVSTQIGWGFPAPLQRGCTAQGEGAPQCWALGRDSVLAASLTGGTTLLLEGMAGAVGSGKGAESN